MAERHVLLLGGTAEARSLAGHLDGISGLHVLTSLAGRTSDPAPVPGPLRRGGFGGVAGLTQFLTQHHADLVLDATHPFAQRITANAIAACVATGVPYLRLERPAWVMQPGDRWLEVRDLAAAWPLLPRLGRRVLVAGGRGMAEELPEIANLGWIVRSIERPDRLPGGAIWESFAPHADAAAERAALEAAAIDVILTRASGGEGAAPKLAAARALGLPVVMLRRPPCPEGIEPVATVAAAMAAVRERFDIRAP